MKTHPKYRRSHIQGLCCGESGRDFSAVAYGSSLIQTHRVWLGSHGFSLLARSSQHYLVVESVFFEVQLARTRSQSNGRIHGWGMKSANERVDRRQKHQKPRRQSSVVQLLLRLSYKTRFGMFFFLPSMHTVIFMYSHTKAQCLLFIAELSSQVSSPRGKLFTNFKAFVGCGDTLLSSVQCQISLVIFQYSDHAQHVIEKLLWVQSVLNNVSAAAAAADDFI